MDSLKKIRRLASLWAERAYRRGVQQGVVLARHAVARGHDLAEAERLARGLRHGPINIPNLKGIYGMSGSSLEERHWECDGPSEELKELLQALARGARVPGRFRK